MSDEHEIASLLESLASPEADERSAVLLVLAQDPIADARVVAGVEALIHDRAACWAQPPAALTEVRWYAAHALAAARRAAGIAGPVRVFAVVPPLEGSALFELAEAAYGDVVLRRSEREWFEMLRADGKLPIVNLSL